MFELFSRRRRTSGSALVLAAASGAAVTGVVAALAKSQRRARIRDRATSAVTHFGHLADKARRDARNRAAGFAAHAAARKRQLRGVPDEKLVARVRSTLGRFCSHPHAVEVHARDGHVVLTGLIVRDEMNRLLHAIRKVIGVRELENRLATYERKDEIAALKGPHRVRHVPELLQEHWTPSLRVAAGILGAAAMASGLLRLRSVAGLGMSGFGALLLARATFDEPIARILGLGAGRDVVELRKTMIIHAPIEQVFAYWADFERFPEFMDHVQQVRMLDEHRSHWIVRGPLGAAVEWDAETTAFIQDDLIAWQSVEGSQIKNAGSVRFEPDERSGGTRIDVRISYNPVAGYLGHGIAALFRVDPKKSLDDDLLRLKSLIEEGSATAHGHKVTREAFDVNAGPQR